MIISCETFHITDIVLTVNHACAHSANSLNIMA